MTGRMKDLIAEYGAIATVVYLATSVVVGAAATIAILYGFEVDGAKEGAGTAFAVWLTLKATQIPRIAFTLFATPLVARSRWNPFPKPEELVDEQASPPAPQELPAET